MASTKRWFFFSSSVSDGADEMFRSIVNSQDFFCFFLYISPPENEFYNDVDSASLDVYLIFDTVYSVLFEALRCLYVGDASIGG